jgi:hypothetical protein
VKAAAADWMLDPAGTEAGPAAVDRRGLELAIRLAGFLASPSRHVHVKRMALAPFSGEEVLAMARHDAFCRPVETRLAAALGLQEVQVGRAFLGRLATSPSARLAVLLVTQPFAEVGRLATALAAAVLSRRVTGLILKAEREAVRRALGEEAFSLAVQEVPLLHPVLGDLDGIAGKGVPTALLDAGAAESYGHQVLRGFLAHEDPALAHLHDLTRPPGQTSADGAAVRPFQLPQVDHVVRFVRRRQPQWSAIIG